MVKTSPTTTSAKPTGSKWFLIEDRGKYKSGVYFKSELQAMPKNVTNRNTQSLSSAIRQEKVIPDLGSAEHVDDLNYYAPIEEKSGLQKKLHGVKSGVFQDGSVSTTATIEQQGKKISNTLRTKIKAAKKKAQEDSLKAKIAAKKANENTPPPIHPSDSGH